MMIPHRLSLLSPEKSQYLKRMVSFQFIKNLLEIVLIVASIAGITFLGGQWVLEDYFNKITAEMITTNNHYSDTNIEIKKVNNVINKIDKIQNEYYPWGLHVAELAEKIPNEIILQNLNFDEKNKKLTLQGSAETRDGLLELKNQLLTLSWVKAADIPPGQLTGKTNLSFSILVVLK